jgi:hypothetical protein
VKEKEATMEEAPGTASRRSFVTRAGLALAAALGVGAGASVTLKLDGEDGDDRITLRAQNLSAQIPGKRFGEQPLPGEALHVYGDLTDPHDRLLGELRGSSMPMAGPGLAHVETHVLSLAEGTILGMATILDTESVFAVVGGTGKYAGASGTYTMKQRPRGLGGDGTADIVIELKA